MPPTFAKQGMEPGAVGPQSGILFHRKRPNKPFKNLSEIQHLGSRPDLIYSLNSTSHSGLLPARLRLCKAIRVQTRER